MKNDFKILHEKALHISSELRANEKSLIELLMPIERTKGFLELGYSSMFAYCVGALKLSETQSYTFISIARKSEIVPELNLAVQSNEISVSNARRLVSVITTENKAEWIKKAAELSQRELEREVVKENPTLRLRERIKPLAENLSEWRVGITPEIEEKLRRVREVASSKGVSQQALLDEVLSFYLKHKDPLQKLKRTRLCPGRVKKRVVLRSIPKAVEHEVNERDHRQCQYKASNGKVCGSSFWVQLHHVRPWGKGGGHEADNLTTLCRQHHELQHREKGQAWPAELSNSSMSGITASRGRE